MQHAFEAWRGSDPGGRMPCGLVVQRLWGTVGPGVAGPLGTAGSREISVIGIGSRIHTEIRSAIIPKRLSSRALAKRNLRPTAHG